MDVQKVDLANWPRREFWNHYMNEVRCTYAMTAELDASRLLPALKRRGLKLYPALIHMLSQVVHRHEEFRYNTGPDGEPVLLRSLTPSYTVFHSDDQTFSNLWTPYSPSFRAFHAAYLEDLRQYGGVHGFDGKPGLPENCFWISSIPWVRFTGFHLDIHTDGMDMSPIFTFGKCEPCAGQLRLPLCAQLHHAVCDGFHAARLFNEIQALCDEEAWLDE